MPAVAGSGSILCGGEEFGDADHCVKAERMKVLFLDESGNHGLVRSDIDYPIFVLGGVIADADYVAGVIDPALRRFKLDLFGRDDLILHTADIARNRNGFEQLVDARFRDRFYQRLNTLMAELEYQVVACAIRKQDHLARYGIAALDPYLLSLDVLVERFCYAIADDGGPSDAGLICAERRSPVLDRELDLAWLNIKVQGTQYVRAGMVSRKVAGLELRDKRANIAGLQLADLLVSPIGRYLLGKQSKRDWEIVESKFRRRSGSYLGSGLVVLPK